MFDQLVHENASGAGSSIVTAIEIQATVQEADLAYVAKNVDDVNISV